MIKEIKENGFRNKIKKNNEIKIRIQEPAAAKKHWSDCIGREQDFKHYVDRRKQEFDVHVASILWEKKKSDNDDDVVDCIEIRHEKMMQGIKD